MIILNFSVLGIILGVLCIFIELFKLIYMYDTFDKRFKIYMIKYILFVFVFNILIALASDRFMEHVCCILMLVIFGILFFND